MNLINFIGPSGPMFKLNQSDMIKSKSNQILNNKITGDSHAMHKFMQNSSGELTQSNIGIDVHTGKVFNIRLADLVLEHENFTTFR